MASDVAMSTTVSSPDVTASEGLAERAFRRRPVPAPGAVDERQSVGPGDEVRRRPEGHVELRAAGAVGVDRHLRRPGRDEAAARIPDRPAELAEFRDGAAVLDRGADVAPDRAV